ncbi:MAG: Unknown protein [uncultured Aureispira sp.]|jgi:hypothetical protein|uniref:Fibronectin type-III domain-containing protein n=1 Tax=uncultured Aureispira sp. TaxID=1331704 RepID=A0A6S6TF64_9BACT|nr:MAG: Unknown protein [uncultured Aureispira sp.]
MKNLQLLFALIVLGLSFSACEKQLDDEETVTATINSPTEGAVLTNGNSLNVNVTFTDPTELHNYSIIVLDENTNTAVLDLSGHTHNTSYTVDSTITLSVATHSTFKVTAIATNHSGETATDVVPFEVHP